jgi:hypothetical protein
MAKATQATVAQQVYQAITKAVLKARTVPVMVNGVPKTYDGIVGGRGFNAAVRAHFGWAKTEKWADDPLAKVYGELESAGLIRQVRGMLFLNDGTYTPKDSKQAKIEALRAELFG